jgi:uncharacterized protein YjaZ
MFKHDPDWTVPEEGTGGFAPSANEMFINMNADMEDIEDKIRLTLPRTLAHEYHHNLRWSAVGYGKTVGEVLTTEGLADHFSMEVFPGDPPLWTRSHEAELAILLELAKNEWDHPYDHQKWFFGEGDRPFWGLYKSGFKIVSDFLETHPDQKASQLWDVPATEIIIPEQGFPSDPLIRP